MEKIDSQNMRTESMSRSDVSFPGISLEDSLRIVGTNIVFFSQGAMFLPEDVMFNLFLFRRFGIF